MDENGDTTGGGPRDIKGISRRTLRLSATQMLDSQNSIQLNPNGVAVQGIGQFPPLAHLQFTTPNLVSPSRT